VYLDSGAALRRRPTAVERIPLTRKRSGSLSLTAAGHLAIPRAYRRDRPARSRGTRAERTMRGTRAERTMRGTRAVRTMRARRIRGGPQSRPVARPSRTDTL